MKKLYCEKCGCQLKRSAACGKCGNINYQLSGELKKQNSVRLWVKVGVLAAGAVVITRLCFRQCSGRLVQSGT